MDSAALPADPVQRFLNRLANSEPGDQLVDPPGRKVWVGVGYHGTVVVREGRLQYTQRLDVYTDHLRAGMAVQGAKPLTAIDEGDGCEDGGCSVFPKGV